LNYLNRLQYELTGAPYTQFYSTNLMQFITYMLAIDPFQRPTLT